MLGAVGNNLKLYHKHMLSGVMKKKQDEASEYEDGVLESVVIEGFGSDIWAVN